MNTTKTVTLEIPAYYTPDGERTCQSVGSGACPLLRSMFAGTEHFCAWDDGDVADSGTGYLRPSSGCPLDVAAVTRQGTDDAELLEMVRDLVSQGCTISTGDGGEPLETPELETSCLSAYEYALEWLERRGYVRALIPGRRYVWTEGVKP